MFKRITNQEAKHSDGYFVKITGRNSIQYVDGDISAEAYVEFGSKISGVYKDTLKIYKDGVRLMLPAESCELILKRIKEGLLCLDVASDI